MSAISSWYTQQYSGTFRNTRLRAPSLVPRNGVNPVAQQTLVVDAARTNNRTATDADDKNVKRRETIFGPDVGEDDEPGWTQPEDGAKIGVDVIKGWVERAKSEEGLHATTTLQALVNLKRPTLQLQQLEAPTPAVPSGEGDIAPVEGHASVLPTAPLHVLKFNYDATTPHVNITLSIYPSPQPAVEGKESIQEEEDAKVIYTGTHVGGFNQIFNLPPSSAIDLSSAMAPMPTAEALAANDDVDDKFGLDRNQSGAMPRDTMSEDTNRSSLERSMGGMQLSTQPDLATVPEVEGGQQEETRGGRLGRMFGRRGRREPDVELGQMEMTDRAGAAGEKTAEEEEQEAEKGMRLLIKIEGVGAEGEALKRRNAQLTHILINGMWVPEAGSQAGPAQAGKRVWVVKVVRREAVIGAHTFLLKEIYGLSSASNQNSGTNYPPQAEDPYASTPNECIVCLTSPRDVVLLPCRHLVVCRDCAVGMVEFGAGGKVARRDEGDGQDTTDAGGAAGTSGSGAAATGTTATASPAVAGGTTTGGRERRKKKAKGWYCPVCRQPYTSLLRLALPENAKPGKTPAASRMQSRAASIRSVRTTHTLHRSNSRATLPEGAERMLNALRPAGARDSDEDDDEEDEVAVHGHNHDHAGPASRDGVPQFVLGPEVEEGKAEVEHQEVAAAQAHVHEHEGVAPASASVPVPVPQAAQEVEGRISEDKKGWKQV